MSPRRPSMISQPKVRMTRLTSSGEMISSETFTTNNALERFEMRRRTRVVGVFPDGESALNLAIARLRYVAGCAWSMRRYLNMELLKEAANALA
jgi:transposase-like protein